MSERVPEIDVRREVLEADRRIRPWVLETPVELSPWLGDLIGGTVWLKLDLQQTTGSFKFRGATSKILSLTDEELDRGLVSASTGNYALAVAEAARIRERRVTVYVARTMPEARVELLESHGLDLVLHGNDPWDAEREARSVAEQEGRVYLSPYNDPQVVGGQGTCGLEVARQVPEVDTFIAACGGGGLVSGSAGYLKSDNAEIEAIAVSPEKSPVMHDSLRAGAMVEMETHPTLADTCAGGIDLDTITFPLCQRYVDEFALVSESEIEDAIRLLFDRHRLVAEGSAALGVACLMKKPERFAGRTVVPVVCGKNIGTELFKSIICRPTETT